MEVIEQTDGFRIALPESIFFAPLYLLKADGWTIQTARAFHELTLDLWWRAWESGAVEERKHV